MQTLSGDSAYRSGLEIRPCNRPFRSRPFLQPALAAGPLVPTSEGPRPVGGHAFVLVGVWGRIVQAGADQLDGSAQAAARGLPILQDFGRGLVVSTLAGMGFRTDDPRNSKARTFVSADGATGVQVLRQRDRQDPFTTAGEPRLEDLASGSRLVAFAYSSTLRRIYRRAPAALEQVDATVILNLDELRRSADKITVGATGRRS